MGLAIGISTPSRQKIVIFFVVAVLRLICATVFAFKGLAIVLAVVVILGFNKSTLN